MQFLEHYGNIRNNRDTKLITTKEKRNCLVPKPNYHATKTFSESLLAIKRKRANTYEQMNEPVYLDLSILEESKTVNFKFLDENMKPKY